MTSKSKKKRKAKPSLQKVGNATTNKEKKIPTQQKEPVHPTFNRTRGLISFDHHEIYELMRNWWQGFIQYYYKLARQERRLAEALRHHLKELISNTTLLLIFTLVGLNSPASYPPLFTIIHEHKTISIIVILLLTLYFVRVLLAENKPKQEDDKKPSKSRYFRPLLLLNVISYACSLSLLCVLLLLSIRPGWCPTIVCPTLQSTLLFHPQSVHDENLEMYFLADQSTFYTTSHNPTRDMPSTSSVNIPVLHTDGKNSSLLYHLTIGLNSLQHGHIGMIIEEVNLVILEVDPIPHPLNVWHSTSFVQYENENQYRAFYQGQQAGAIIPADYLRFQQGFVELKPEETDQIDLHVVSQIEANIWFTVQVVYRIGNEAQLHTLRLAQQFEIMFANKSDWHLYHL